jgi:hypothetical protein
MSYRVERTEYDPQDGFLYYVAFKPTLELEKDEIHARVPVQVALSLSETGEIADLSFVLPKTCRSDQARTFLGDSTYVEPRMLIAMPEQNGDAVVDAPAKLDLDLSGRIVGMEIHWMPSDEASAPRDRISELEADGEVIQMEDQRKLPKDAIFMRRNPES